MEDFKYKGLSAEEWEELSNPAPPSDKQLEELGFIEPNTNEQKNIYDTADKLGIEHPDKNKELLIGLLLKAVLLLITFTTYFLELVLY